jgi:hypothetical protein
VRVLVQAIWTALLAALVGLVVAGKSSAGLIVTLAIVFAIVLVYWLLTEQVATARFPALGRLPGSAARPRLALDPLIIQRAPIVAGAASGPVGTGAGLVVAEFVKCPISNDPRAAVAAEDVQGWLRFDRINGENVAERVQARWAHTEQAPDRSPFARLDDPALNEVQIPAGSIRHLDVVTFADEFGGFRMWTNQSMLMLADPQYRIDAENFIVTLTVRGSNTPPLTAKLRVEKGRDGVQIERIS